MVSFSLFPSHSLLLPLFLPPLPFSLQDTVAERECCNVMCKCTGHEGIRGNRGRPGTKVRPSEPSL